MSATLKKITARAKQIRKKHPSMKWVNAIKTASAELRKSGSIGATQKPYQVKRKRIGKAKRRKVIKVTTFKKVVGRVARKKVAAGKKRKVAAGSSNASLKGRLLENLKQQLGKLYVKYYMTQSIKETNKLSKQIAVVKRQIKQYQRSK